jgi:hypothetical protein
MKAQDWAAIVLWLVVLYLAAYALPHLLGL